MSSAPGYTPSAPYRGNLPLPLTHGSSFVVNGVVPPTSKRFHINLETESGDKALHFNPRFAGANQVVRNSCINGAWGAEQTTGYFPFSLGAMFEIMVLVEEQQYRIAVNGQHYCEFPHRVPKDYVRRICVEGEVLLSQIRFQPASPVPINANIPGGLQLGRSIKINGVSGPNANRFNVNLVHGTGFHSNSDVALQVDVRFNHQNDKNVVVRNSRSNGKWGNEERQAGVFPFTKGAPFEIVIRVEQDRFKIIVNNQTCDFLQRLTPANRFDCLFIQGDAQISGIQFQ